MANVRFRILKAVKSNVRFLHYGMLGRGTTVELSIPLKRLMKLALS